MAAIKKQSANRRTPLRKKLLLAVGTFVFTVALLEGCLWLLAPLPPIAPERAHEFLPSWTNIGPAPRTIRTNPGPLSGVTPGTIDIAFNSFGYLYPQADHQRVSADELRIAVVGGSTVECSMLAADKRWSAVLEARLRDQLNRPVTVLNLGASAQDTRTHLATTSHIVTDLDVDACVFMLGANDLGIATASNHPMLGGDAFYPQPSWSTLTKGVLRKMQISRHLHRIRKVAKNARTTPYFSEAAARQASMPNLTEDIHTTETGLAHYSRNVKSLAGLCKEHGIAVLFTTQPCMFPDEPTAEQKRCYWGCHTGAHQITPENFVTLLAEVNGALLTTCKQQNYVAVDLASQLPKGLTCFYDQVHFNEEGARQVAQALVDPVRSLLH